MKNRASWGLAFAAAAAVVGVVGYQVWAGKNTAEGETGPAAPAASSCPGCCGGKAVDALLAAPGPVSSGCGGEKATLVSSEAAACPFSGLAGKGAAADASGAGAACGSAAGCCGGAAKCPCADPAGAPPMPEVVKAE